MRCGWRDELDYAFTSQISMGPSVLLLGGSSKSDQKQAIRRAKERLKDFRERNDG